MVKSENVKVIIEHYLLFPLDESNTDDIACILRGMILNDITTCTVCMNGKKTELYLKSFQT